MTDSGPTGNENAPTPGYRRPHRPPRAPGRPSAGTEYTPPGGPTHGHGHGHGRSAPPASQRAKRLLAALLIPCALAVVAGAALLYPYGDNPRSGTEPGFGQHPVNATVQSAAASSCTRDPSGSGCATLGVLMQDGPRPDQQIELLVPTTDPATPQFAVGDDVVLSYAGSDPDEASSYQVVDYQRGAPLLVLGLVFAAAVVVLGRMQGVAALAALGLSFVVLVGFVLPAILAGQDPLLVAVVGAGLIMFTALYLTHGFSARTSTAVLGTLLSLGLIGALSALFAATTRLTGLDEESSGLLGALGPNIDTRGLLLAGIVIGALGVLDDVTVTQTSAVWELRNANPALGWRQLYRAGLRIGRDHVASAVNTLVLAYAGAALPLLLAYALSGSGFHQVITSLAVAQEVVRTLVGSIGLIAAVPITTAIAAAVVVREPARPHTTHRTAADRISAAAAASAGTAILRRD